MNHRGTLVFDQLCADREAQSLEWIWTAHDPESRIRPHGGADDRIESKPLVKWPKVLIDAERETHPFYTPLSRRLVAALSGEQDTVPGGLCDTDQDRFLPGVQETMQHA
jgi:hypothetical protein